jgi:ribose transport system permease protein
MNVTAPLPKRSTRRGLGRWLVESEHSTNAVRRIVGILLSRYITVVLLAIVVLVFSVLTPATFLTATNWQNILVVQAVPICMALAALLPLIAGEFDLSLGYMLGLVAMTGAFLSSQGYGVAVVAPAMIGVGLLVGLANGILTVRYKISSFISTLGVGIVLSGLTLGVSGGQVIFQGIPTEIVHLSRDVVFGIAISVWLALIISVGLLYVLEHTPTGRHFYATGGSERVTHLAGVPTGRIKLLAFVGAGLLVGVAAIFQLGLAGAASPGYGPELLLPAYAACFLGVSTYRPGYYNVPGALIAILLLGVGFNGLSIMGVPFWVQPVFNGAVLLVAVLTARAEARRVKVG